MRKTIFFALSLILSATLSAFSRPAVTPSTTALKKEIANLLYGQKLDFLKQNVEEVEVEFLINAKNEIVILHVEGADENTCEHVSDILNFQKVKYQQPRQLQRYIVNVRLVREHGATK